MQILRLSSMMVSSDIFKISIVIFKTVSPLVVTFVAC